LLAAGAVCGAVVSGEVGEILAIVLIGSGLVWLVGLAFLEVGLSEDRERERERRRAERLERPEDLGRRPTRFRPRRRDH
jgi:hypothetical protein